AALTSPRRNDASALPVLAAPALLVINGVNDRFPDDPRSRISSLAPVRYSPPNLNAWHPRAPEMESITCRSMIGVWKRGPGGLPSDAVPKLVVAAEAVAD